MELLIVREPTSPACTFGKFFVGDERRWITLEDTVRPDPNPETPQNEGKVYGKTAIPVGRYRVILSVSPHFGKNAFFQSICKDASSGLAKAPELLQVPGFGGVRIHVGNYASDSEGCILIGKGAFPTLEMITQSRLAYRELMALLMDAERRQDPVWLTIQNPSSS